MTRYTLADLEKAERDLAEGDSGRHSNPGRTKRWNRQASEKVARIREALIEQGDIAAPTKSAAHIEKERVARGLRAVAPNPKHNDVVEFEGERYRCKYRKAGGVWFRKWEPA